MSGLNELSPRLKMVGELVPEGARLADVGTDHAYLPAALLRSGRIPFAIAADLRQGPLARAKATVRGAGLEGRVAFRLCDGLSGIRPEEVDAVVIAGMGGETIADILAAAPWVRENRIPLVLQPMSSMPDLRVWLQRNGYRIVTERLCREGDTLYTALSVQAGEMPPLSPAEQWSGRSCNDPLRGAWLEHWIGKTAHALEGLSKARQEGAESRRAEMEQIHQGLLDMKKEWEAWQR